jgi:hypothetical protein
MSSLAEDMTACSRDVPYVGSIHPDDDEFWPDLEWLRAVFGRRVEDVKVPLGSSFSSSI